MFSPNEGTDIISDLNPLGGLLDFQAFNFADFGAVQAQMFQEAGGVAINLFNRGRVFLRGVQAAEIEADHVLI